MIIRTLKNKENPFVMMDKRPLEDSRLSWKAKGLLAFLLSRPDNWTIVISALAKTSSDGETAIRSALNELKSAGYARLEVVRGDSGRLDGKAWVVIEHPSIDESDSDIKETTISATDMQVSRISENPNFGKSDTTNNDSLTKKDYTKKELFSIEEKVEIPKELQSPMFKEAWELWKQDRKERKMKLSSNAERMQLKTLQGFGLEGAIKSIHTSIEMGWRGLFKPNQGNEGIQQHHPQAPATTKKIGSFTFSLDKPPTKEQCGSNYAIYLESWQQWVDSVKRGAK